MSAVFQSGSPPTKLVQILTRSIPILTFCSLVALVVLFRAPYYEDESYYLNTVSLLHERGLSREFLRELPGPAGPLYTFVHALAEPLTHLAVPGTRLVNVALILFVTLATSMILKVLGQDEPITKAAMLLTAPVVIVVSGLALTEVPAMACFYTHLALLLAARRENRPIVAHIEAALAGLLFGLSVLGRQQYLLILAIVPILLIGKGRRFFARMIVYLLFALPLPIFVFAVWRNLVPPQTAFAGAGIAPAHGLLAFGYGGLLYCIYDERWLWRYWRHALVLATLGLGANVVWGFVEIVPMRSVALRLVSEDIIPMLGRVCGGTLVGIGVAFAGFLAERAWSSRNDGTTLFLICTLGLILASAFKITHQFSSRYVSIALPTMVVLAADGQTARPICVALMTISALLGLASLASYYANQMP